MQGTKGWLRPKHERPVIVARRERAREYAREKYAMNKRLGICVRCGWREAEPDRVLCRECRLFHNQIRSGSKIS